MATTDYNHSTKVTASVMGVLLGMAGALNHGLFELLQGNTPTPGFYIDAIGEEHRFWLHGTEGAFTLIPNFLFTGIAATLVSIAVIIWSLKYLHTRHGATVFLLLMIGLTLVGGGLGHIILFLPTWAYATRIRKSLTWWKKTLPEKTKNRLARLWLPMLVLTALSWLTVMELGIFGYFPGLANPDLILKVTLSFLLLSVLLVNFTFVCAFACDLRKQV